jgi:hypothetical protein
MKTIQREAEEMFISLQEEQAKQTNEAGEQPDNVKHLISYR